MKVTSFVLALAIFICLAPLATAQSASDKVYLTNFRPEAGPELDLIGADATKTILTGWVKTSNVGAILAGVSMECAVWTNTSTLVTSNTGKTWSSARAAVKVDVLVDNVPAVPGQVVFCDRAQYVGLTLNTTCELTGSVPTDAGCTVTDTLVLDLFQKTKSANHFNFYIPNKAVASSAAMHKVDVIVHGAVECLDSKNSTTCSETTFGTVVGKTKAAIGKATLVVEDINNSNL